MMNPRGYIASVSAQVSANDPAPTLGDNGQDCDVKSPKTAKPSAGDLALAHHGAPPGVAAAFPGDCRNRFSTLRVICSTAGSRRMRPDTHWQHPALNTSPAPRVNDTIVALPRRKDSGGSPDICGAAVNMAKISSHGEASTTPWRFVS